MLLCLQLHYARHAFPGLKSTKNFGSYFKVWPPYFECSGAGTGLNEFKFF